MTLLQMYEHVFSDESMQQRAVPEIISQGIKEKIHFTKVLELISGLKEEMDKADFEELRKFLIEWTRLKEDHVKVDRIKDVLVTRAYKADVEWSVYETYLLNATETNMMLALLRGFPRGGAHSVSPETKARLLQCIAYAIKVGLNYQELEPFAVNLTKVPNRKSLDEDDIQFMYPGQIVSEKEVDALKTQKKVHLENLKSLPLYEGITFPSADLGEYIRTSTLKAMKDIPVQLVNPTKRKVLQMIYNISPDFKLNLDELDNKKLKELCKLDLPMIAEASNYFYCVEHEAELLDKLDKAYDKWLLEGSFKKYMGISSARPFLTLSPIREVEAKSVEDVLAGDSGALESLVYHVKPSVIGLPRTSVYDVDVDYAKRLSQELQDLNVLPSGYDYLCAVKAKGVQSGKRKITIRGETLEMKSDEPLETKEDEPVRNLGRKRKSI